MYNKSAPETIQAMFGKIAPHYDRANAILSFGLHRIWNETLVKNLSKAKAGQLLDLCAGTGAIAFRFLQKNPLAHATLLDFCPEMLAIAQQKGQLLEGRFATIEGDAQALPLMDHAFEAVSMAYGIRNVQSPEKCFSEVHRVLKPGGSFGILELTRPSSRFLQMGHQLYLRTFLPLLGKWIAKDQEAYQYLSKSIHHFVSPDHLIQLLNTTGFSPIKKHSLMQGIATLIIATRIT